MTPTLDLRSRSLEVALRPACAADAEALTALGSAAFNAAFGHLYDPRDLEAFLAQTYSPQVIAAEIANPALIHRLALDGEALVGFAKLCDPSPYAGHSDARRPIALGQLYTDPARTGCGVGALLMDWALEDARRRGADALQLSVWSGNEGAQRFYARRGLTKIADIDFWVGHHRDDEFLLELRL